MCSIPGVTRRTIRVEKALFGLAVELGGESIDYSEFLREADMNEERFRTVVGEADEVGATTATVELPVADFVDFFS